MNNAEKFKQIFGLYATELWAMPEEKFLEWLNAESLEKQAADKCCETCKYEDLELETYPCCDCIRAKDHYISYTEEEEECD